MILRLALLLCCALAGSALAETAAARPNMVFLLIDGLGRSDVGFMGSKDFRTPHIDALAHGNAILDAHYLQPMCSPTRTALMPGRYATRMGAQLPCCHSLDSPHHPPP